MSTSAGGDQGQPRLFDLADPTPAPDPEAERIRAEYRARLAEKLKDPEFRKIEGFPIGTDEAILALSDPPFYTACPNPFLEEWLAENAKPYDPGNDTYHREPFAADVSEGKNDPIYNAHSYHTKVPHKAIMRYILHYTEPGDVVYDGFCGSGMTGVAAQMCGSKEQVESLGYRVEPDGTILDEEGKPFSKLGARKAILNDLSPAATFIAYNYNTPVDPATFRREAERILAEVENECGWMYTTLHGASPGEIERIAAALDACTSADEARALCRSLSARKSPLLDPSSNLAVGRINYVVWSDVLVCPTCGGEIVFWDVAVDKEAGKVRDTFACPSCRAEVAKSPTVVRDPSTKAVLRRVPGCDRAMTTFYDTAIGATVRQAKQVPVLVSYTVGKKRIERPPHAFDLALIACTDRLPIPHWFPTDRMPEGYNTEQPKRSHGLTHVHHFYTRRNLHSLAAFTERCSKSSIASSVIWARTGIEFVCSRLLNFRVAGAGKPTPLQGTLYVSSLRPELNAASMFRNKAMLRILPILRHDKVTAVTATHSAGAEVVPVIQAVDYIFTDPPFGGNLMYSELNFLWEAWLRVRTNNEPEAITSESQKKGLAEYQGIMTRCFQRFYEALKPGRWMTVEFHNSSNSVWNAIGEALERVGFVIADVRTIDKQQGTFKQVTTTAAVKQDLVISCYKPRQDFEERFARVVGKREGVVEFVRQHLGMLPVAPIGPSGAVECVAERTRFLLFDRMVAYHLQRGAPIPMSAAEFYKMLNEQFVERDGMYYLPEQAARYDALKARGIGTEQLSIFVKDEKSAVQWIRARLSERPMTLGELTPLFMQEQRNWEGYEVRLELRDILREYFVEDDGVWRVPDPDSEHDIEAMRRNGLLRQFRDYVAARPPLKVFRTEALIEGFRHCWETKQYGVIVAVCEKIPPRVLQEIHELVQFYDIARDLAPREPRQVEFEWD